MNISHIIYSIDEANGGPSRSVTHLLEAMAQHRPSVSLKLYTGVTEKPIIREFQQENCNLNFYTPKFLGRLQNLEKDLLESNTQLFHGQAIWDLPVHQMAITARRLSKPYIITPRGMLEPWSLSQSVLKKRLALKLYQFNDLKKAHCLHATAEMEADNLRELGLTNPIAVIPNGVHIENFPLKSSNPTKDSKRKLLFLSRIHKKKGIELLLEAWGSLPKETRNEWHVDIIGNGNPEYINKLKNEIKFKGLEEAITIKDPIYGGKKCQAYQQADVFVLPSYSENFGIVIAEALATGTPVITTKGTPWQDLGLHDCGWHIDIGVEPLYNALEQAMSLSDEERKRMGRNGRKLIEDKYSMVAVASQMYALYEWILTKKKRPSFVKID